MVMSGVLLLVPGSAAASLSAKETLKSKRSNDGQTAEHAKYAKKGGVTLGHYVYRLVSADLCVAYG